MRLHLIFALLISCVYTAWAGDSPVASLLDSLDVAIRQRPFYLEEKEERIENWTVRLRKARTDYDRFDALGKLLEEYRSFDTDSVLSMARRRYQLALRMGNPEYIANARMNVAEVMGTTGMYKEALDTMSTIPCGKLPGYLHPYYYHIYRTIYGLMADYSISKKERQQYNRLTDFYRDSLLLANEHDSFAYLLIKSDQLNAHGQAKEAIRLISEHIAAQQRPQDVAMFAFVLSQSYHQIGDSEQEMRCLILSAIEDVKSAVRDYVALRQLAMLLYEQGDVKRAYSYLKLCMDDAVSCNARFQIVEVQRMFPIVNEAYQRKMAAQQSTLKWLLVSVSLLSLFLLLSIVVVRRQKRRLAIARTKEAAAARSLQQLNDELMSVNEQMKEANRSIAENSYLKEEYIGWYMEQCSLYLAKMDDYRRRLRKLASTESIEALSAHLKSTTLIDDELKEFYRHFDNTFLSLFPTFIEDFNQLLAEDERIVLKSDSRLNTELRIFALIRLGITDSAKIAKFLRYSITTIYNYRTRMRNKAAGNRDQFEQKVMQIGKLKA